MAKAKPPSAAVLAARARRGKSAEERGANIEWFVNEVSDKVAMTLKQRVTIATSHLKTKIVRNISRPVTKTAIRGGRDSKGKFLKGRTRITDRSKPGEFPKADTTQLMKTIFEEVREEKSGPVGYVGTPLDYGLILEVSNRLNRSYFVRTLNEEMGTIKRILTGPIK